MKKSFFSEIKKNHKKTFYTFIYYEKKKNIITHHMFSFKDKTCYTHAVKLKSYF